MALSGCNTDRYVFHAGNDNIFVRMPLHCARVLENEVCGLGEGGGLLLGKELCAHLLEKEMRSCALQKELRTPDIASGAVASNHARS